jgi:hypothetical protein
MSVTLSPARDARRDLAIMDALDAHEAADDDLLRQRCEELVRLNERLYAEQKAERGYVPETIEGCIAVLAVAERLLRMFGDDDEVPDEKGVLF